MGPAVDDVGRAVVTVDSLAYTPVKSTTLVTPDAVEVGLDGIPEDRLFHILDRDTRKQIGASRALLPVRSDWRESAGELAIELPDGRRAEGRVELGERVTGKVSWDGDRPVQSREILGPWSRLLSDYLGKDVVLTRSTDSRRAVDVEPMTLASLASVRRVERQLDGQRLGTARFRMNVYLDGLEDHDEDRWYGRRIAIGEVQLMITGPIARCASVTYDPDTGERDAHTLKAIVQYREPIADPSSGLLIKAPFGVYGRVERPGRIQVGDPVELIA